MIKMLLTVIFLIHTFYVVKSAILLDLNGQWLLKDEDGKYKDLKASVPGGIYSDLMNNNIIEDIFYGFNDDNTRWVPRNKWTYYRNFSVDSSFLLNEHINLIFEGLDTFSQIFVNNIKVGESNNMFVQYIFNIKEQLKVGSNQIVVKFQSPIEVADTIAKQLPYDIPLDCPPKEYRGECHVNLIRKMQASFSWDWGPSFPSVGIWKNIFIESYQSSVLRYLVVDTIESDESWTVNIDTYFAGNKNGLVEGTMKVDILLDFINITQLHPVSQKQNSYGEIVTSYEISFPKSYVHIWWPNGYGAQNLYIVQVQYTSKDGGETDTKQKRIGFKTVKLVQEAVSLFHPGLTFHFEVNGVSIFMKGSNEIPINILPERGQDRVVIKKLLESVKLSNMNMLRVWGGGVYESDYFYDLANELGILIWQDFMFACSLYPSDDQYLSNIIDEVRHQVKRLRSFTNIVVYSGNNENEGALANNWYNTKGNYSLYTKDYVKLYINTIKKEFDRLTHARGIFISSSPTNGIETEQEGWVAKNPGDTKYGDVHFYNYILDAWNPTIYPTPRFASEYGYQSLPSVRTILQATNETADLNISSSFMDHRQHHPMGYAEMVLLISIQLQLPDITSKNYDKAVIFYSQILQAMAVKIETEHYRTWRSTIDKTSYEGRTMGALYWQLNDVWVAPTWSGIDYAGRWKMLQYFAKNFFAPVIIFGHIDEKKHLVITVASDLLTPIKDADALIQIQRWDSFKPHGTIIVNMDQKPCQSDTLVSFPLKLFLRNQNCTIEDCFIFLSLSINGVKIAPDNFVLPTKVKRLHLMTPDVKIDSVLKSKTDEIYEIQISSDATALFVWLESTIEGRFSDNGFLMNIPVVKINFYPDIVTNAEEVQKSLIITHLRDKELTM